MSWHFSYVSFTFSVLQGEWVDLMLSLPSYPSTTRFEKLDITPKSAQKIKPVLERWMKEAEERWEYGGSSTRRAPRASGSQS